MTLRKCKICNEYIQTQENSVPYKNGYCHEKCFNLSLKLLSKEKSKTAPKTKAKKNAKPKAELKDGLTEEQYAEKKAFYAYLKSKLDREDLSAKIYAMVEKYIEKYNFTYQGMQNTIQYFIEVLKRSVEGDLVGIIPYYYSEACDYYKEIDRQQRINEDIIKDRMKNNEELFKKEYICVFKQQERPRLKDITSIGVKKEIGGDTTG